VITVQDSAGNSNVTSTVRISVEDNDAPVVLEDLSSEEAIIGDHFRFEVNVSDNIGILSVNVVYWYRNRDEQRNITMDVKDVTPSGNGTYILTRRVSSFWMETGVLNYYFTVLDTSGNQNLTTTVTHYTIDDELPVFGNDFSDDRATTGDAFSFRVYVEDNYDIRNVTLTYWFEHLTDPVSVEMGITNPVPPHMGGYFYEGLVIPSDAFHVMVYYFTAVDSYGNVNTSQEFRLRVVDDDNPSFGQDSTPDRATTGDDLTFSITVLDNVGVEEVVINYSYGDSTATDVDLTRGDSDLWEVTIALEHTLEDLRYLVTAHDFSGNEVATDIRTVTISDNDPPSINYEHSAPEYHKGGVYSVPFRVEDNIGVDGMFIVHQFGTGAKVNESAESGHAIPVPRHPGGDLMFHIAAVDVAGNWKWTTSYQVTLVNLIPQVSDIPTWMVIESTDAERDLSPFITVQCSDENVTVDGLKLRVRHDIAVEPYMVSLTVSDGEDQVETGLEIHVVNVNDLPVVELISPLDGAKFTRGDTINFSVEVEDEDGDEIVVTWIFKDMVFGTGMSCETAEFGVGEHRVTVRVSDSNDIVDKELTIIVKKREKESPGFGLVVALAAVLITYQVARRRQ
jgi:hypothetical protein